MALALPHKSKHKGKMVKMIQDKEAEKKDKQFSSPKKELGKIHEESSAMSSIFKQS